MTTADPEIVATLDDDAGDHCVDILRHSDGTFSYVEYARDTEDDGAWYPRADAPAQTFKTQYAAYAAAIRDVDWLMD